MKCPKCGATENIVHFLRHQKTDENDENTNVNCWTMLCKNCGHNESFLLEELLDEVFVDWSEIQARIKELEEQVQNANNMMQILANQEIPIEAENIEVIDENEIETSQLEGDTEIEEDISDEESETNCESDSNDSE